MKDKLKVLERSFLRRYPLGFETPELLDIAKKHKMEKMQQLVEEELSKEAFKDLEKVFESYCKLISRSSLVSVFEKTNFRNQAKVFTLDEIGALMKGVYEFLYGDQALGFDMQVKVLTPFKLAKWPILTVPGLYLAPQAEVLVKPTTVKGILKYFEVDDFKYTSKPNYEFYVNYRTLIQAIKTDTQDLLQVDNAAFCGFLMVATQEIDSKD